MPRFDVGKYSNAATGCIPRIARRAMPLQCDPAHRSSTKAEGTGSHKGKLRQRPFQLAPRHLNPASAATTLSIEEDRCIWRTSLKAIFRD